MCEGHRGHNFRLCPLHGRAHYRHDNSTASCADAQQASTRNTTHTQEHGPASHKLSRWGDISNTHHTVDNTFHVSFKGEVGAFHSIPLLIRALEHSLVLFDHGRADFCKPGTEVVRPAHPVWLGVVEKDMGVERREGSSHVAVRAGIAVNIRSKNNN